MTPSRGGVTAPATHSSTKGYGTTDAPAWNMAVAPRLRETRRGRWDGPAAFQFKDTRRGWRLADVPFVTKGAHRLPTPRAGEGDGGLVRHALDQGLVLHDLVARLDQPLDDLALHHALADVRQLELELGHVRPRMLSARAALRGCGARAAGTRFRAYRERAYPSR